MLLDVLHGNIHIRIDVGCPNGSMDIQIDVRFPKWVHGFPNRSLIFLKMEHAFPNQCWISHMGTWVAKSMLDFQNGNMVVQIDVGCQFTHWVQTMGSNNGFKRWVQTMGSNMMHKSGMILICWMMHSLSAPARLPSSPPFLFPVACHLQPLGNSIAGPLHNTAVEQISYVYILYVMMQALIISTAWMHYCRDHSWRKTHVGFPTLAPKRT